MKVALYARNSKPPSEWKPKFPGDEPPGSWMQQLESLRTWAQREGHEVVAEEHDAQVSGKDPNRPGWRRIIAKVKGHHVAAVAAVKLDRVMRSSVHFHDCVKLFDETGVDLIFTEQGLALGKRNPMTKAMIGFLSLMAELERDWAVERQAAVMRRGDDGRTYGPRSSRPAGRPVEYGEGHRFRVRNGMKRHDRLRCKLCRSQMGGGVADAAGAVRASRDGGLGAQSDEELARRIEASDFIAPSSTEADTTDNHGDHTGPAAGCRKCAKQADKTAVGK